MVCTHAPKLTSSPQRQCCSVHAQRPDYSQHVQCRYPSVRNVFGGCSWVGRRRALNRRVWYTTLVTCYGQTLVPGCICITSTLHRPKESTTTCPTMFSHKALECMHMVQQAYLTLMSEQDTKSTAAVSHFAAGCTSTNASGHGHQTGLQLDLKTKRECTSC
jgi:hypothetical protein